MDVEKERSEDYAQWYFKGKRGLVNANGGNGNDPEIYSIFACVERFGADSLRDGSCPVPINYIYDSFLHRRRKNGKRTKKKLKK